LGLLTRIYVIQHPLPDIPHGTISIGNVNAATGKTKEIPLNQGNFMNFRDGLSMTDMFDHVSPPQ